MNPLPPEYDWIGYLAVAVIVVGFVALFLWQRREKARDTDTHWPVKKPGFPRVYLPNEVGPSEGDEIVLQLQAAARAAWNKFNAVYRTSSMRYPIGDIWLTRDIVSAEHPEVAWYVPGRHQYQHEGDLHLRIQDAMFYWFVGELHNCFRWQLHRDRELIYETVDETDLARARAVQAWIDATYRVLVRV